jgi:hypothetical protein
VGKTQVHTNLKDSEDIYKWWQEGGNASQIKKKLIIIIVIFAT